MRAILVHDHVCDIGECGGRAECLFEREFDFIIIFTMVWASICSFDGVKTEDSVTVCTHSPKAENLIHSLSDYWEKAELYPRKRFIFKSMNGPQVAELLRERSPDLQVVEQD